MKLKLDSITFSYDGSRPMFENVSLSVKDGEVAAIVEAVGSGKSTLLKVCAGLLEPQKGTVSIDDQNFWALSEVERNDIRRRIGFDFQESALIANMTISGNLLLPLKYHGEQDEVRATKTVDALLERFGISQYKNVLPAALSVGLRRKVSFARAMLLGKDAFYFDEPTQVADSAHLALIEETIKVKSSEGKTCVIATSDMQFAKRVSDRIIDLTPMA